MDQAKETYELAWSNLVVAQAEQNLLIAGTLPDKITAQKLEVQRNQAEYTLRQKITKRERINLVFGVKVKIEHRCVKTWYASRCDSAMIQLKNISTVLGAYTTVNQISFSIKSGEIMGLITSMAIVREREMAHWNN